MGNKRKKKTRKKTRVNPPLTTCQKINSNSSRREGEGEERRENEKKNGTYQKQTQTLRAELITQINTIIEGQQFLALGSRREGEGRREKGEGRREGEG
jgi:hypothetical protein